MCNNWIMSKKLSESIYKTSELIEMIGKRGIQEALDNEEIFNFERGYYISSSMPPDISAYLYAAAKFHPEAIISKNTALFYYGLSEHMPERIDLDVSRDSKYRNGNSLFEFYRTVDNKIFDVVEIKIREKKLKIYSPERALFECLYYDPKARGMRSSYALRHFVKTYEKSFKKVAENADLLHKLGQSGAYEMLNILTVLIDDRSIY